MAALRSLAGVQRLLGLPQLAARAAPSRGAASPSASIPVPPGSSPVRVAGAHEEEEEVTVYAKVRGGGGRIRATGTMQVLRYGAQALAVCLRITAGGTLCSFKNAFIFSIHRTKGRIACPLLSLSGLLIGAFWAMVMHLEPPHPCL